MCVTGCNKVGINLIFNKANQQCECEHKTNYYNIQSKINNVK